MRIYVDSIPECPELDNINIHDIKVDLESHATIHVVCRKAGNEFIEEHMLYMSGADYQNWNADDLPYVKDFVLDELGLTEVVSDGYSDGYQI